MRLPAHARPTLARRGPLRLHRADLRPVERLGRRGHRVLRRGGTRCDGPVVELAVGSGRIAVPIAQAGIRVIGVDLSEGMLAVARDLRRGARCRRARRPPARRPARAAGRRARAARHLPLSLAAAHARRGREAAGAPRRRASSSSPAAGSSSTSSRRAPRTSRRRTASGSSASRASSSAPTGTRRADADAFGPVGRRRRLDGAALALRDRVAAPDRRGGLRRRGAVRVVRPPPLPGRRGHDLGLPARDDLRFTARLGAHDRVESRRDRPLDHHRDRRRARDLRDRLYNGLVSCATASTTRGPRSTCSSSAAAT